MFSVTRKTNEILPPALEKIKSCLFKKKAPCSFRLEPLASCRHSNKQPHVQVEKRL